MAKIKAISYVTPENYLSNDELVKEFKDWSAEKVTKKVGITKRFVSGSNELVSDLAVKAAEKLFSEHNINRGYIDLLILCTQSPDYALPTTACIVQDKLKLSTNCGSFDFNLGCSGYVYGLAIAKGFLKTNISKNILLITSETYTKYLSKDDKSNRAIFGDAASATLISNDGIASIENFVLGSDGSGAENLIVRNSASKIEKDYGNKLFMNGPKIFEFTMLKIPNLINEALIKNNLDKNKIDLFVFHQANKFMLNHLRKKIGISENNFYIKMDEVGNTVSSTIPIALYHAIYDEKINTNDNVLIAGFGVGLSWGATVLKFQ